MNTIGGAQERAKLRDKELVKCTCIDCGIEYEITRGRFRRIKDGNYRCKPCMKKWHDAEVTKTWANKTAEEMNVINNKKTEAWNNKSDEERAKQMHGTRSYFHNLNDEEREEISKQRSENAKAYYTNRSEDQSIRHSENISKAMKSYYSRLDEDELNNRMEKIHDGWNRWWNSLSKEEQDFEMSLVHQGHEEWWESLSKDERKSRTDNLMKYYFNWYNNLSSEELDKLRLQSSVNSKKYWDSLSDEERLKAVIPLRKGYDAWWESLSHQEKEFQLDKQWAGIIETYNPRPSELEFIDLLKIEKLNFECQYRSKEIPENFYEKYAINPITNSFVSARHTWDFIIHTKNRSVLVDIDGSIHDSISTEFANLTIYNGKKINLKDSVDFYDNQRIMKTDGMDAYVIKCYTDKLNMDDKVINIKTKEEMTLRSFIALLNSYNLTQTEMKELMKNL